MLRMLGVAGSLLAMIGAAASEKWDGNELVLTDLDFETELESRDLTLVLFYASWCGASKQMFPYFTKAADLIKKSGDQITLAKVDAEENQGAKGRSHASPGGMTGYPTLKVSRNGVLEQWTGSNSRMEGLEQEIVNHIRGMKRETVKLLSDAKEIKDSFSKKKVPGLKRAAVVGYFGKSEGIDRKLFNVVAGLLYGSADFYAIVDKKALDSLGFYGSGSTIKLYRPWEKKSSTVYNGVLTKTALRDWLTKEVFGPVPVVAPEADALFKESVKARKLQGTVVAFVNGLHPDPTAKKPEDWDQPEEIPDPDSFLPDDWDVEEDGEWSAPPVPNPDYKGRWSAPLVFNDRVTDEAKAALQPVVEATKGKIMGAVMEAKRDGPGRSLAEEIGFSDDDLKAVEGGGGGGAPKKELEAQIADLETKKLAAAENEEFEKALELKEQILRLRAQLESGGGGGGGAALPTRAFAFVEPGKKGRKVKYDPLKDGPLGDWAARFVKKERSRRGGDEL
eukprot:Hpha_TRINITY_DN14270_c0_g1::TRINITY_DN14270_c0_g1_i1::g.22791::m.22791